MQSKDQAGGRTQGINSDAPLERVQPGQVRFALNLTDGDAGGDRGYRLAEIGNALAFVLSPGQEIVGSIAIEGYGHVVFSVDGDNVCEVTHVDLGDVATVLVRSTGFGFSTANPIRGVWDLVAGCRRVVYWADGLNPDRFLDLDRLGDFTLREPVANGPSEALVPVGRGEANARDLWDLERTRLVNPVGQPSIGKAEVLDYGGLIEIGQYRFAFELVDADGNVLARTDHTRPILVTASNEAPDYRGIGGGYHRTEEGAEVRVGAYPRQRKSIRFTLTSVDSGVAGIRLVVSRLISGDGAAWESFRIADEAPVGDSVSEVTFVGIRPDQGDAAVPTESVLPLLPVQETSLAMAISGGRLFRGNLSELREEGVDLQRLASQCYVSYAIREASDSEEARGNERAGGTPFDLSSEIGDEVVALGVQFLVDDTRWTPVFHIPGRPRNYDPVGGSALSSADARNGNDYRRRGQPAYPAEGSGYDDDVLPFGPDTDWYAEDEADYERKGPLERWEVFSTAFKQGADTGLLGFYECRDEVYPYTDKRIWGVDCAGEGLTGRPVRHHRMPDRALERAHEVTGLSDDDILVYAYDDPEDPVYDPELYSRIVVTVTYDVEDDDRGGTEVIVLEDDSDPDLIPPSSRVVIEVPEGAVVTGSVTYDVTYAADGTEGSFAGVFSETSDSSVGRRGVVRLLGLKFHGIDAYPEMPNGAKVTGHRFVRVRPDPTTDTVIDAGGLLSLQHTTREIDGVEGEFRQAILAYGTMSDDSRDEDSPHFAFVSASETAGEYPDGVAYLRVDANRFHYRPIGHRGRKTNRGKDDWYITNKVFDEIGVEDLSDATEAEYALFDRVVPVESISRVKPLGVRRVPGQADVMNWSMSQAMTYVRLGRNVRRNPEDRGPQVWDEGFDRTFNLTRTVTLKRFSPNRYGDLANVRYVRLHDDILRAGTASSANREIYGGYGFVTENERASIFLSRVDDGIWGTIGQAFAVVASVAVGAVVTVATLGLATPIAVAIVAATVAGVTAVAVDDMLKSARGNGEWSGYLRDPDGFAEDDVGRQWGTKFSSYIAELVRGMYADSRRPFGLLHGGFDACAMAPKVSDASGLDAWAYWKLAYWDEEGAKYLPKPVACPNQWEYNEDFTGVWEFVYEAAPDPEDYFDRDCRDFPNLVSVSEEGLAGEKADGNRVFLPLELYTVNEQEGPIRSLVSDGQRLYVLSGSGARVYDTRARQIQSSAETLYLGDGQALTAPSLKIGSAFGSSVGCFDLRGWSLTPWGLFCFDRRTRSLHLIGGEQPRDITEGIREVVRNIDLPMGPGLLDAPNAEDGRGAQVWYDDERERLMLSVRSWTETGEANGVEAGSVFECDGERFYWSEADDAAAAALIADGFALVSEEDCVREFEREVTEVIAGESTTNVYVFYDATSQQYADASALDAALLDPVTGFFTRYRRDNPQWTGQVYTYPTVAEERWVQFGAYPWRGRMTLSRGAFLLPVTEDGSGGYSVIHPDYPPGSINSDWSALYRPHPGVDPLTGEVADGGILGDVNAFVMSFVDESAPGAGSDDGSTFYHPKNTSGNSGTNWDQQPRPWYLEDYGIMADTLPNYERFRGINYPIVQGLGQNKEYLLHAIAAIEGDRRDYGDILAPIYGEFFADFDRISRSNPYAADEGGPGALSGLGWVGVYDKRAPVADRLTDGTFDADLDNLFTLTTRTRIERRVLRPTRYIPEYRDTGQTWSWSPKRGWVSAHSYSPSHVLQDGRGFVSFAGAESGWRHHVGPRLSFYGERYPATFEFFFARPLTSRSDAVSFVTTATDGGAYVEETFDRVAVFGRNESTGWRPVFLVDEADPYAILDWASGADPLVLHERVYSFARAVNRALPSESIRGGDDDYRGNGPDGRQGFAGPVPLVHTGAGDFGLGPLSERAFVVRLERSPSPDNDDLRLVVDVAWLATDRKTDVT